MTKAHADFFVSWAIWTSFLLGPVGLYLLVRLQANQLNGMLQAEISILSLKTFGYLFAIVLFPFIGDIKRRLERKREQASQTTNPAIRSRETRSRLPSLIIALSLAESIGILGFILFLFGDSLQSFYLFLGMSALGILLHRPQAV